VAVRLVRAAPLWIAETDGPDDRYGPKKAGFRWDGEIKRWWTDRDDAALALREYADPEAKEILDEIAAKREKALEASRATDAAIEIPTPEGLEPYPFQRAGIAYALDRPNVLFGDEMGLGKTIQAIGLVNADPSIERVLVVCPASLRLNWKREFEKWTTRGFRARILTSKDTELPDEPVAIVNYDILKKLRGVLRSVEWDLLVADEAHYLKSGTRALRGREVLGKKTRKTGKWVDDPDPIPAKRKAFLSGTPITNRPIEGWPLLHALAPETFRSWRHYVTRYCAGYQDGYGWQVSGASNLEELQEKARSTVMIRRLKRDVLPELPPKQRQVIEVPANGVARVVRAEREAWELHETALRELRVRVELAKASDDPEDYATAVSELTEASKVAFTEMARLRHDTAVAKVPFVVEHVRDALEGGEKLIVFAHHHDVVDALVEGLSEFGPVVVTGKTSMKVDKETGVSPRQAAVDRFQSDPETRVFVGNIQAAGVGLTLTASSHVVFAELDWVPGNVSQAEDRAHRIGQTDSVLVQHLVLEGSLDARIAEVLVEKQEVLDRVLDRETDGTAIVPEAIEAEAPAIPSADKPATYTAKAEKLAKEASEMTTDEIAAVRDALRIVGGLCDGAIELDGQGFSKIDTAIGTDLASLDRLTPKQAALGRKIVRKYRRQFPEALLEAMGAKTK